MSRSALARSALAIVSFSLPAIARPSMASSSKASLEFPEELRPLATSVSILLGHPVDRSLLLAHILGRMDQAWNDLEAHGGDRLIRKARALCDTLGHLIEVQLGQGALEGVAEDLDSCGRLVLRLESGARRLLEIGEIRQTRRMD